jgi:2-C-methyl-D-erythritol 2,4-cyclodiphosphate synthase
MYRIGIGYDIHKFKKGRRLILGGVQIKHAFGLDGHSDADVLVHAIMDALLGAAGLLDIGSYFPNTDARYKNISSLELLSKVMSLIKKKNLCVVNIDSTVAAEEPKIMKHANNMKKNIAKLISVSKDRIGIKATTNEGIGSVGRKEGIAAIAVCLLRKK